MGASINEQVMQYGLLKNGTRPRLLGNKLNDTCFSRDTVSDDELSTMRKKLMTKHPFLTEERHDV
ncbi:MAG: hypothetical protein ACI965_001910 [Paraglaciecola sp.]